MKRQKADLASLTKKWYKRLEDKGFKDIELPNGTLKAYHSMYFNAKDQKYSMESKQRYYELARQFLHTYPFATKRSKNIWELHSEGWTQEAICEELDIDRSIVGKLIRDLEKHFVGI